jgi:hypothetical protein
MMPSSPANNLHFLCTFQRIFDVDGKPCFAGTLGNRRLLIYADGQDLQLFMGEQIKVDLGWKKQRSTMPAEARSAAALTW